METIVNKFLVGMRALLAEYMNICKEKAILNMRITSKADPN